MKQKWPGYERGSLPSFYFVPDDKKSQIQQDMAVKLPIYMREFPVSWRDIDHGIAGSGSSGGADTSAGTGVSSSVAGAGAGSSFGAGVGAGAGKGFTTVAGSSSFNRGFRDNHTLLFGTPAFNHDVDPHPTTQLLPHHPPTPPPPPLLIGSHRTIHSMDLPIHLAQTHQQPPTILDLTKHSISARLLRLSVPPYTASILEELRCNADCLGRHGLPGFFRGFGRFVSVVETVVAWVRV